ncbi:hypothetical protein EYZ11_001138 [Aspergillus tanneri]|uniref:Alpha-L-arabinofuranosidase n=1 Tax=Aspergillus tanneri TaxID=1220188 RepID=A0A4S3JVF2_9EURO|nr:hypothetical protein EYZ11_001138 [Aspergillus tanneri]
MRPFIFLSSLLGITVAGLLDYMAVQLPRTDCVTSFKWSSSKPPISSKNDNQHLAVMKDSSIVEINGTYHDFAKTAVEVPIGKGYFAAPHVFFFEPQNVSLSNFPKGMGDTVIALSDSNKNTLFEAFNLYNVGDRKYLLIAEAIRSVYGTSDRGLRPVSRANGLRWLISNIARSPVPAMSPSVERHEPGELATEKWFAHRSTR